MSGDDIVERLREHCGDYEHNVISRDQCNEVADEVERLRAEIKRLRAALALAVGELSTYGPMRYTSPDQLMEHFINEARS